MKNKILGLILGGVALITVSVQAVPINGAISFDGGYALVGGANFLSASAANILTASVTPGQATGTYASLNGGYAFSGPDTFGPIQVNPTPVTVIPLWQFTTGGITYSFDATSVSLLVKTANIYAIEGYGVANVTGFDATPGYWNVTLNRAGASFSFSSSAAVPDGGMTLILLGTALTAMGLIRRKMA